MNLDEARRRLKIIGLTVIILGALVGILGPVLGPVMRTNMTSREREQVRVTGYRCALTYGTAASFLLGGGLALFAAGCFLRKQHQG